MADVNFILTAAGAAALVNAANTGTAPVIISHCGVSATAVVPSMDTTVLTGEIKRISTLSGGIAAPDTIHVIVRDESTASYSLRSLALYTDDGTLFAIYGQSGIIMQKSAGAMLLLTIDAKFVDVDASLISFGDTNFLNPPATETMQGVIEIATQPEANSGVDDQRALTAKKARLALMTWLLAQDGAGSGLDADLLDGQHASAFLQASLFTGAQILSRLVTADGAGSGLDADLLDGQHASDFLQASLFTGAQMLSRLLSVDGAGSGLDADLLDGQDGSYYTNIVARLGFTPLNAANYTAADVFNKVLGLDGAGSGLDADLLAGQAASYYTNIVARLGFTPLNAANYTAADIFNKVLGLDGAGSGLDADLLDGRQATDFIAVAAMVGTNQSLTETGWQKLPGGLIVQWGAGASEYGHNSAANAQLVTFPIAFPTAALCCLVSTNVLATGNVDAIFQTHSLTRTNVRLFNNLFNDLGKGNCTPRFLALGY